jgi:hypothetical protein
MIIWRFMDAINTKVGRLQCDVLSYPFFSATNDSVSVRSYAQRRI